MEMLVAKGCTLQTGSLPYLFFLQLAVFHSPDTWPLEDVMPCTWLSKRRLSPVAPVINILSTLLFSNCISFTNSSSKPLQMPALEIINNLST